MHLRKHRVLHGVDADWLSKYQPIARAGGSIYIYRCGEPGERDGL